ncbi:MAG: hypothetical protein LBC27_10520 [Spirochaetaceae bacterium]|jgi:diacylglycerol kinase family enzyme|nr:hypothetical protein [Spirochaetaceae bacterium]
MIETEKKHLFIINPVSFLNMRAINKVIAEIVLYFDGFKAAHWVYETEGSPYVPGYDSAKRPYAVHISRFPRDAIIVIRHYAKLIGEGTPLRVYSIGGDGILFDCLNGVMGLSNVELAAVPYGSGCDFCRAFGEGLVAEQRNIAAQIEAPVILMDVIDCGNAYAINSMLIGLEGVGIYYSNAMQKKLWKLRRRFPFMNSLIYLICGIKAWFNPLFVLQRYTISIDGERINNVPSMIYCANGPGYALDKCIIAEAVPDDGFLEVMMLKKLPGAKFFSLLPVYLNGKAKDYPDYFLRWRAKSVSITSDKPLAIGLDGECFFDTDLNMRLLPKSLRFVSIGGRPFKNRALETAEQL